MIFQKKKAIKKYDIKHFFEFFIIIFKAIDRFQALK